MFAFATRTSIRKRAALYVANYLLLLLEGREEVCVCVRARAFACVCAGARSRECVCRVRARVCVCAA